MSIPQKQVEEDFPPTRESRGPDDEWFETHYKSIVELLTSKIPQGIWHDLYHRTRYGYMGHFTLSLLEKQDTAAERIGELDRLRDDRYGPETRYYYQE